MSFNRPSWRAAIRDGYVTLHPWWPRLVSGGPGGGVLDGLPAALVNLTRLDDDELLVSPVQRTPFDGGARDALLAWATAVGYRRVWLPGEVIEFDGQPPALGRAAVRCPTCGAQWRDEQFDFWQHVRERGCFPGRCLACGGSLPEWTPLPALAGSPCPAPARPDPPRRRALRAVLLVGGAKFPPLAQVLGRRERRRRGRRPERDERIR